MEPVRHLVDDALIIDDEENGAGEENTSSSLGATDVEMELGQTSTSKTGSTVDIIKTKTQEIRKTILKGWYDNLGLVLTPPIRRRKRDTSAVGSIGGEDHLTDMCRQNCNSVVVNSWTVKMPKNANKRGAMLHPYAGGYNSEGGRINGSMNRRPGSWIDQQVVSCPVGWSTLPRNWTAPHQQDNDLVWL